MNTVVDQLQREWNLLRPHVIIITWLIDMITKYKVLPIFKKVQVNLKAIYGSLQYNRFIHSENKSPRDSVGCPFALLSIPNQIYWTKKQHKLVQGLSIVDFITKFEMR